MSEVRLLVTGGSGFIGSNFIAEVDRRGGYHVLNLDRAPARFAARSATFRQCDLLDRERLEQCFVDFQPTHVVHLAARTDMFGTTVDDYAANHIGTSNVVSAIQRTPSVENVVFTSSQYVMGPGRLPQHNDDYAPHTIYGHSKVLSEKVVREAKLSCSWTIIRPTNIWGRWHPRYPSEFWRVLKQGRYLHPGGPPVMRCYGYVGSVVDQVLTILARDDDSLRGETLYVGDPPVDLYEWTNTFSLHLTGKPVRIVPRPLLKGLAVVGDMVVKLGGKFPIFSSRFRSMTENYLTPMDPTFAALGPSKFSLEEGVQETVAWLRSENEFWSSGSAQGSKKTPVELSAKAQAGNIDLGREGNLRQVG